MLYIRLFHGRRDPEQDMQDWGSDGPIFGPYEYVHITYKNYIRICNSDETSDELYLSEDMLFYDGVYYGDWIVLSQDAFDKSEFTITDFEQDKANLPEKENK